MSAVHPAGSVLLALEHDDEDGSIAFFSPCKVVEAGRKGWAMVGSGAEELNG